MAKTSDNKFPKVVLEERASDGSDTSNPAADHRALFLGEDGSLHLRDSSGTVTDIGSGSGSVATDTLWDAAGDLAKGTGANTADKLTKGAAGTVLVAGATTISWVDVLPWHISLIPMIVTPDATTGTWAMFNVTENTNYPFLNPAGTSVGAVALFNSSTAQNDAIAWDVILAAGTWDMHAYIRKSTNTGIITLQQDAVDQGTADTYAAAAAFAKVSVTGFTVATTGKKRMNFKAATKNASSSGYLLEFFAIEFRRTA